MGASAALATWRAHRVGSPESGVPGLTGSALKFSWRAGLGSRSAAQYRLRHKRCRTKDNGLRSPRRRTNTNSQVPQEFHTRTHTRHVSNTHSTQSRPVSRRSRSHAHGGVAHASHISHGARHSLSNAPSMPQLSCLQDTHPHIHSTPHMRLVACPGAAFHFSLWRPSLIPRARLRRVFAKT